MKKKWLTLADIVTFFSLMSAVISIFFSIKLSFKEAALFMVFAVFFDFMDGRVARFMKQESDFGAEIDSMSDLISFGVAPIVFFLSMFNPDIYMILICLIFVCCSAYRLARFNLQGSKKYFFGMPTTVNGVIFPVLFLIGVGVYVYVVVFALSSLLMISRFKISKI